MAGCHRQGPDCDSRPAFAAPLPADDEADRLSVTMANAYGNGHPWLGCAELKQMTRDLALAQGVELLLDAADATLFSERQGRVAVNWH